MDTPNTQKVISQMSEVLAQLSKDKLKANDSVRTGRLLNSIVPLAKQMQAGVTMETYGKFLEQGTTKMKAKPFISPNILTLQDQFAKEIEQAYALDLQNEITPMFNTQ